MSGAKISIKKKTPILQKQLKVNFSELSKAIGKAALSTALAKWDNLAENGIDALSALGLKSGVEETAWLLIYRSYFSAITMLLTERSDPQIDYDKVKEMIHEVTIRNVFSIDSDFFAHPERCDLEVPPVV